MYLKRLEIQGFKSFANKTVLEFEKGITSVVGPNGSGKSNIADSIRWVLGEQSLKQLRGKKSEDVIFAGSEKKAKQSFAEVTVTFDNSDHKIPLEVSEVSITRSIDRSGESDYSINGNKVRLLDVVDLILKSNINTSRYTVIGQGTIDQMILSGPAEVKNLMDEASGVKTYHLRRDKTLKRLETTTQNLMRVQDLLAEIEPRLKSLRRQAKRMQERAGVEEELKLVQREYYAAKYWKLEGAIAEFVAKLSVLEADRTALESELQRYRANLDKSESDNRGEIEEYQKIQSDIKKLSEQKNKLLEDSALVRGKLQAQKNAGSLGSNYDAKSLQLEKNNIERAQAALHSQITAADASRKGVLEQLETCTKEFANISGRLAEVQQSLENPEKISFEDLANDVEQLHHGFAQFYTYLESATEISSILPSARKFKENLNLFKDKTLEIAHNPLLNFEKQRKSLNELLSQKDRISQELNRLKLAVSKENINIEYLEREISKNEQKLLQVNLSLSEFKAENQDQYFGELLAHQQQLDREIAVVAQEISVLENKITEYHTREQSKKNAMLEEERAYRAKQDLLSKFKDSEYSLQIEKARLDTQKDSLVLEIRQALGDELLHAMVAQPNGHQENLEHAAALENKIAKLKNQLDMIGGIDELTLKEFQETDQRYTYLTNQVADLQKGIADLREVIEELDVFIKNQFQKAFDDIDAKFQNYFRILFNGGRAYLSVVKAGRDSAADLVENDENNEHAEEDANEHVRPEEKMLEKYEHGPSEIIGIDIKATPPGKKLSSISALSGGERALTSIALLCALLSCFPSPFVVLDEVDAALDEANTIRFAEILGTLGNKTQFICVTHNRETMRKAHTLYGVTMGNDSVSKILSIKIEQAQAYAK